MATTYDNKSEGITQLNRAQCNIVEHSYEDACKAIGESNPSTTQLKKYFKVRHPPPSLLGLPVPDPSLAVRWQDDTAMLVDLLMK